MLSGSWNAVDYLTGCMLSGSWNAVDYLTGCMLSGSTCRILQQNKIYDCLQLPPIATNCLQLPPIATNCRILQHKKQFVCRCARCVAPDWNTQVR